MSEAKVARIEKRRPMGPRTPEGRARALAARIRGKLPHSVMIVPGVEKAEDWESFRDAVIADYSPSGTIETELAHRIAELLWRLRRFSRYETDCASWRMKTAEVPYHQVRAEIRAAMHGHGSPPSLPQQPQAPAWRVRLNTQTKLALWYLDNDDAALDDEHGDDAPAFIEAAARAAGVANYRPRERAEWTIGAVRQHLSRIATRANVTADRVLELLLVASLNEWTERDKKGSAELRAYTASLDQFKRTLMLPTESEVRTAARWESHLERSLCRIMDRLERLQRMRAGELIPPPAIVRLEREE